MEIGNENSLSGFGGFEESSADVDFFNLPVEDDNKEIKTDAKSVIEEISKDDITEEGEKKKTPETKEEDLFLKEESPENEKEDEDDEDEKATGTHIATLNILKGKGYIDFELEDGVEMTEELAEELLEEKYEESVDSKVKEVLNELPDLAQQIIKYTLGGGRIEDFLETIIDVDVDLDADLDKEDNQIAVMKDLLALEDKDDEEIETEIEFLKDSGKLKVMAEKKLAKYKADYNNKQKQLIKDQEAKREADKLVLKETKAKMSDFLNKNAEVDGITFTKEDKKSLPSYVNDKNIKLQNGTLITQMQKELFYDIPKNEKAMMQLATLLKNRNEDGTFNFSSIAKDVQTKIAKEVKGNLRRDNKQSFSGNSTNKGGGSGKSLADYFNQ